MAQPTSPKSKGLYIPLAKALSGAFRGKSLSPALSIAAIGYSIVAIEILAICRFNGTTAVGIVSTLDLGDLIVTVPATSLLPWVAGLIAMVVGFRIIDTARVAAGRLSSTAPIGVKALPRIAQLAVGAALLTYSLFAPIAFMVPLLLCLLVAALQLAFRRRDHPDGPSVLRFLEGLWGARDAADQVELHRAHKFHRFLGWVVVTAFAAGIFATVLDPRPWVSAESLELSSTPGELEQYTREATSTEAGEQRESLDGWVFASEDGQLRVLTYSGRKLIYVPLALVKSRAICEGRRRDYLRSLFDLLVSGSRYEDCSA